MLVNCPDMVRGFVVFGLTGLGHNIAYIYRNRRGPGNSVSHSSDEKVGNNAGVKAAGPQNNDVRFRDGGKGLWDRFAIPRLQKNPPDALACARYLGFTFNNTAVFKLGTERALFQSCRKDLSPDGQNLAHLFYGCLKVSCNLRHGGNQQVTDTVAGQAVAVGKTVLQQFFHQCFFVSQGYQAVSDVTGRKYAELTAQPSGTPPVVSHGNNCCNVAGIFFKPPQEDRKTGPAADNNHFRAPFQMVFLVDKLRQVIMILRDQDLYYRCNGITKTHHN